MNQSTFSFPHMIDRLTKKVILSQDRKSINECLGILLRTRRGELLGDPEYGCSLIERIFMYEGIIVEQLIKEDIMNAINKFEPRVYTDTSMISIIQDTRVVRIFIQYVIKETGVVNDYNMEITPDDNPYKL